MGESLLAACSSSIVPSSCDKRQELHNYTDMFNLQNYMYIHMYVCLLLAYDELQHVMYYDNEEDHIIVSCQTFGKRLITQLD